MLKIIGAKIERVRQAVERYYEGSFAQMRDPVLRVKGKDIGARKKGSSH